MSELMFIPSENSSIKTTLELWDTEKSNTIKFIIQGKEILVLESNGNIYVNGRLAENDKEVVQGMRDFLTQAKNS